MAQRKADWRVGVYVRVHGHLRSFENKKSMVVFSLKVVHDFNEASPGLTWMGGLPSVALQTGCDTMPQISPCCVSAGVLSFSAVHFSACAPYSRTVTIR